MDKTFQLSDGGPFGKMLKLSPMTTEYVTNQMNCFQTNGTKDEPVTAQSVLPGKLRERQPYVGTSSKVTQNVELADMTGYQFKGKTSMEGRDNVEKWHKEEAIEGKINKYTMWLYTLTSPYDPTLKTSIPIKFQMKGYNVVMGSHYDHCYITYYVRIQGDIFCAQHI